MQKKFLVKLDNKLKIIPSSFMDNLSPNQAMAIGLACSAEQQQQLLKDAVTGDKYYYGRKVVDGLEQSLIRIDQLFPSLRECIQYLSKHQNSSSN